MSEALVEVRRGRLVESIHRGDLAVVNSAGRVLAAVGDPVGKVTYWRSAAKPFQALPLIHTGAADRWQLSAADLALVAGSHNGEAVHTDQASTLMTRIGCGLSDLACGAHAPLDQQTTAELLGRNEEPTALHNNCSGKHLGMLALAEHLTAGRSGYQASDHPVQAAIVRAVADFSGIDEVVLGVDGCGVPCFGTSIYGLALAFARLMDPRAGAGPYSVAAQGIRSAMSDNPYLVAGRGRLDTDLMLARPDGLISKGGAAGIQCVGLPGGIGLAVKMEDGSSGPPPNPGAVATIAVLHEMGFLDDEHVAILGMHARPALRSVTGEVVGEVRAVFDLVNH